MIKQIRTDNLRGGCQPLAEQITPTPETCIFADKSTGSTALAPAIAMPEWLQTMETNHLGISMPGDEAKLRFAIQLAAENVRQGTGGPFGAAIFELQTDKLVAVGVNLVMSAQQSWAHAEMTAFSNAQQRLRRLPLKGYMLVTSCEPCAMCFGATPWSGVEKLVYGAPGTAAEKIGFDEGEKIEAWHAALSRRGIAVVGPLLADEAEEPFKLYAQKGGMVY